MAQYSQEGSFLARRRHFLCCWLFGIGAAQPWHKLFAAREMCWLWAFSALLILWLLAASRICVPGSVPEWNHGLPWKGDFSPSSYHRDINWPVLKVNPSCLCHAHHLSSLLGLLVVLLQPSIRGSAWPCQGKLKDLFGESQLPWLVSLWGKYEGRKITCLLSSTRVKEVIEKQVVLLIFWNWADLYHLFCREDGLLEQEFQQELNSSSSILFFFLPQLLLCFFFTCEVLSEVGSELVSSSSSFDKINKFLWCFGNSSTLFVSHLRPSQRSSRAPQPLWRTRSSAKLKPLVYGVEIKWPHGSPGIFVYFLPFFFPYKQKSLQLIPDWANWPSL